MDSGSAIRESWFKREQRRGAMRGLRRDGEEGGEERICVRRGNEEGEGGAERRIMRSWSCGSEVLEFYGERSSYQTGGVCRKRTDYLIRKAGAENLAK